jgi:hypothetical protein
MSRHQDSGSQLAAGPRGPRPGGREGAPAWSAAWTAAASCAVSASIADVVAVVGRPPWRRLRVGDWRILFRVAAVDGVDTLIVLRVTLEVSWTPP